jgi:hypothetical protein
MSNIICPDRYLSGTTDNYVSNEIIVKSLTAAQVWPQLDSRVTTATCPKSASMAHRC